MSSFLRFIARIKLFLFLILSATAFSSVWAGVLSCAKDVEVLKFALTKHLIFNSLDLNLTGRIVETFFAAVKEKYPFLDAASVKSLESQKNALLKPGAVKVVQEALQKKDCSVFETVFESVVKSPFFAKEIGRLHLNSDSNINSFYLSKKSKFKSVPEETSKKFVLNLLNENRAEKVKEIASSNGILYEILLDSMLMSLDPHSGLNRAAVITGILEKADNVGLGLVVDRHPYGYYVISNQNRQLEGLIESGDVLTSIDGLSLEGVGIEKATRMMRGELNSKVVLGILKQGNTSARKSLTIQRVNIDFSSSTEEFSFLNQHILHIKFNHFYKGLDEDIEDAFTKFREEHEGNDPDGLVLDLRDNFGGSLPVSLKVLDLFLPRTDAVELIDRNGTIRTLKTDLDEQIFSGPIVVQVNSESTSAAEIVAQVLKSKGKALIASNSKATFGKATKQNTYMTENSTELKAILGSDDEYSVILTTEAWYVNAVTVQGDGLNVDFALDANGISGNADTGSSEESHEKDLPYAIDRNILIELRKKSRSQTAKLKSKVGKPKKQS